MQFQPSSCLAQIVWGLSPEEAKTLNLKDGLKLFGYQSIRANPESTANCWEYTPPFFTSQDLN